MARNVVLLVLDSVRQDVFAEHASRIPDRATLAYPQCRAASSWSVPSHASMFTGRLPSEHGVHTYARDFSRIDRSATVVGDLPDHASFGASANVFASDAFGFDAWFDDLRVVSTGKRLPDGLDPNEYFTTSDAAGLGLYWGYLKRALADDHPLQSLANGILAQVNVTTRDAATVPKLLDDGSAAIERVLCSLAAEHPEPWFAFANYEECHVPLRPIRAYDGSLYDAPAAFSTDEIDVWDVMWNPDAYETELRHARDLYAAAVEYLDRRVDRLIDRLQAATELETTVVVTADHGENLAYEAEDGRWGHRGSLSEALLHVPLYVVNPPAGVEHVTTTDGYCSHLQLRELLRSSAVGTVPDVTTERAVAEVAGLAAGPDPPRDEAYWTRAIRCAYENERKWEWDSLGARAVYELDHDRPCWQRALEANESDGAPSDDHDHGPDWALDRFQDDVAAFAERARSASETVAVDDATASRLADLGYL